MYITLYFKTVRSGNLNLLMNCKYVPYRGDVEPYNNLSKLLNNYQNN